jgi:transcriptional regulator with PAS, ATPase and Fis domain
MIEVGDLPVGEERQAVPAVGRLAGRTLRELAAQAERQAILEALDRCQGDKEQAAAELQISRASLYSKIKKHGIGL